MPFFCMNFIIIICPNYHWSWRYKRHRRSGTDIKWWEIDLFQTQQSIYFVVTSIQTWHFLMDFQWCHWLCTVSFSKYKEGNWVLINVRKHDHGSQLGRHKILSDNLTLGGSSRQYKPSWIIGKSKIYRSAQPKNVRPPLWSLFPPSDIEEKLLANGFKS